jgi:hypothetical protein
MLAIILVFSLLRASQNSEGRGETLPPMERTKTVKLQFSVWPEDANGDETVPVQSGAGPTAYIRQTFAPAGFRHQESLQPETMVNPVAGGDPVQSTLSQEAMLDLWERIVSSIRVRRPETVEPLPLIHPPKVSPASDAPNHNAA